MNTQEQKKRVTCGPCNVEMKLNITLKSGLQEWECPKCLHWSHVWPISNRQVIA